MVFYHVGRTDELRDSLNTGLWPLTKTLASGTASLVRRLGPRDPGEVVELEPMNDDLPGWTPADDDEEVA